MKITTAIKTIVETEDENSLDSLSAQSVLERYSVSNQSAREEEEIPEETELLNQTTLQGSRTEMGAIIVCDDLCINLEAMRLFIRDAGLEDKASFCADGKRTLKVINKVIAAELENPSNTYT